MIRLVILAAILAGACSTEQHEDIRLIGGRFGHAMWSAGLAGSCLPGVDGEPVIRLYAPMTELFIYRDILAGKKPPSGGLMRERWAKLAGYIEHERAHARQLRERGPAFYVVDYVGGFFESLFDGEHPWREHELEQEAYWAEWTVRLAFSGEKPVR